MVIYIRCPEVNARHSNISKRSDLRDISFANGQDGTVHNLRTLR